MRASRLDSCIAGLGSITLVGLAVSGCSSSASPSPSAAGSASTVAQAAVTPSPSPTGVAAKLLAPGDLSSSWKTDPSTAEAPMSANCPLLNKTLWNASLSGGSATANLSQGLAGPYLVEEIGAGTTDEASKAWQRIVDQTSNCTTYTHSGSQGQSTFTIAKTSKLPAYGDASSAFTFSVTISGGATGIGDIVAARSGNSIVVIYLVGLGGVTKSVVEDAVSKAVAKAHT
jgi:hypothetical protein